MFRRDPRVHERANPLSETDFDKRTIANALAEVVHAEPERLRIKCWAACGSGGPSYAQKNQATGTPKV
jgi:D-tyrosyl-tRNA(Tyr) deacylase